MAAITKEKEIIETPETAADASQLYLISALVQKDEALDELVSFLKKAGVEVKKSENLGPKTLYVKINKHSTLTLVSVYFTAEGAIAHQLQETLRHEEYVERFLLTTWRGPLETPVRNKRPRVDKVEETEKVAA